jgi:hypothetical protein
MMTEENTQEMQQENEAEEEPNVFDASRQAANLAEKEASLKKMEESLQAKEGSLDELKGKLDTVEKDPIAFAESMGLTYDKYTDHHLNSLSQSPEDIYKADIMSKIENLEGQIKGHEEVSDKRATQHQEVQAKEAYEKALVEVRDFIDTNEEDFDILKSADAEDVVLSVIGQHYSETGNVMEKKVACEAVQEFYEAEAKRYVSSDRMLAKLGLARVGESRRTPVPRDSRQKTLTNDIGTQAPRYVDDEPMTRQESIDRSAAKLRWG